MEVQDRRRPDNGIRVIRQNCKNFISFEVLVTDLISVLFKDSCRFLQASLSEQAFNLPDDRMNHTSRFFLRKLFKLARRKRVFPYKLVKSSIDYDVIELRETW